MYFSSSDDELLSCFGGAGALDASLLSRITEIEDQLQWGIVVEFTHYNSQLYNKTSIKYYISHVSSLTQTISLYGKHYFEFTKENHCSILVRCNIFVGKKEGSIYTLLAYMT